MTGFIQPQGEAPLEGRALTNFLQEWFVGLIDIDPTLVRPRWQTEPANIPSAGEFWVAFGVRKRVSDTYAIAQHLPDANGGLGADLRTRHETIEILVSFYDTGVNGQADVLAALSLDNMLIEQNRWMLDQNGFGIFEAKEATIAPVLFKERWNYRVDVAVTLRRQARRIYPISNVESFQAALHVDVQPPIAVTQIAAPQSTLVIDTGSVAETDQDGQTTNT